MAEFISLADPITGDDGDQPGLVALTPDDATEWADDMFWGLTVTQAWNDEWWYGDDGDPFDGAVFSQVEADFRAWAMAKIEPPDWRWYVWRPDPAWDGEQLAEVGEDTPGAFAAALVAFKKAVPDV